MENPKFVSGMNPEWLKFQRLLVAERTRLEKLEKEEGIAWAEALWADLRKVNDALIRLENGTYGVCDECGNQIGLARLELVPQAAHCRACQQKLEADAAKIREGAHTHLNQITQ